MQLKADTQTTYTLEKLVEQWESAVRESALTPSSKHTYELHVRHFLKWVKGDFTPGERLSYYKRC